MCQIWGAMPDGIGASIHLSHLEMPWVNHFPDILPPFENKATNEKKQIEY